MTVMGFAEEREYITRPPPRRWPGSFTCLNLERKVEAAERARHDVEAQNNFLGRSGKILTLDF